MGSIAVVLAVLVCAIMDSKMELWFRAEALEITCRTAKVRRTEHIGDACFGAVREAAGEVDGGDDRGASNGEEKSGLHC